VIGESMYRAAVAPWIALRNWVRSVLVGALHPGNALVCAQLMTSTISRWSYSIDDAGGIEPSTPIAGLPLTYAALGSLIP